MDVRAATDTSDYLVVDLDTAARGTRLGSSKQNELVTSSKIVAREPTTVLVDLSGYRSATGSHWLGSIAQLGSRFRCLVLTVPAKVALKLAHL